MHHSDNPENLTMKTSDLIGHALDWAVAKCECGDDIAEIDDPHFYSTDWAIGGPIIEREGIALWPDEEGGFFASADEGRGRDYRGSTPLIAAMRCYVASRLGDEVEIPLSLI